MTKEELVELIKSELGYPTVKVELDDNHWDKIILRAKIWFRARKGLIGCYKFPVSGGEGEYEIPADSYSIVDVVTPGGPRYGDIFGLCGITELIPASYFRRGVNFGGSMFNASDYTLLIQALNDRSRALGVEKYWIENCGKISLRSNSAGVGIMLYKRKVWDIEELVGRDEDLFFKYCHAITKQVLGRIRVKYSTYPAAGGGITMDGETLLSEALADFEKLDEEIFGSQGNSGGIVRG